MLSNTLYDHLCYEVASRVQNNKERHQRNIKKVFTTLDGNEMKIALGQIEAKAKKKTAATVVSSR